MKYWGNDIVALNDPHFQKNNRINQWLNKVCTSLEKNTLLSSDQLHPDRWRLWSCKESVYKVLVKSGVRPFLNPKRIEILFDEANTEKGKCFKAIFDDKEFWGYSTVQDDWICSVSCNQPLSEQDYHWEVFEPTTENAGKELRVRVKEKLAVAHGVQVKKIVQSPLNIPTVICANKNIEVELSISHHAPYSAYLFYIYKKVAL